MSPAFHVGLHYLGRQSLMATQCAFKSNANLQRSVKNLVGEMDQMFRRHWEARIAGVGG
jgi:hypothetical protein